MLQFLLSVTDLIGWLVCICVGAAGVYELMGGRRVRASALLGGAAMWVVVTLVVIALSRGGGGLAWLLLLLYYAAMTWLVRKVFLMLGKPDIDVR